MRKETNLRAAEIKDDTNWLESSRNKGRLSKETICRKVGIKEGWGKKLIWEQQRQRMRTDLRVAGIKEGCGKKLLLGK
jgi:hypothetical protein